MPCKLCIERGKTWEGDSPICAFFQNKFGDNWNCATVGKLRELCHDTFNLPAGIDHQYCDDQHYVTIKVDHLELSDSDPPLALWMTWYKNRGRTDAMWLLFDDCLPRVPTESECLKVIEAYSKN